MSKLLALSALGPDSPTVVQDLTDLVLESGCNILESRVTRLGTEVGMQLLIAGNWRTQARLQETIPARARKLGLEVAVHESTEAAITQDMVPYAIDLLAVDQAGIVFRIVRFLTQREVAVNDLSSTTYVAQLTGTRMVSLHVTVAIPARLHIATLREEFMMLCDEMNLDAVLEPMKG